MATMTTTVLSICFLVLIAVHDVLGNVYCLQCADVANARDCHVVKQCGPHQVCYSTTVVSTTGRISRKMGCRDRAQCSSAIVGKRAPFRSAGDISICDECCDTTMCQTKLCHDTDYNTDRGPICFKCDLREQNAPCLHTTECGRDEVCFKSFKRTESGNYGVQTGCFFKTTCARIMAASNFHPTSGSCFKCCDTDLCNTDCGRQSASSTGGTIATQTSAPMKIKQLHFNTRSEVTQVSNSDTPWSSCYSFPSFGGGHQFIEFACIILNSCFNCSTIKTICQEYDVDFTAYYRAYSHCVDATPQATCKAASSIVCQDKVRAQNARCMHYCGFC